MVFISSSFYFEISKQCNSNDGDVLRSLAGIELSIEGNSSLLHILRDRDTYGVSIDRFAGERPSKNTLDTVNIFWTGTGVR